MRYIISGENMNGKFVKNAFLLTATGLILRGLGMLLRVYVSNIIGEEGMGLYQLISSAYFLFITLAQSGLPVAVTRLSARSVAVGDRDKAIATLKRAILIALCMGLFSAFAMLSLSGVISRLWIADTRALTALRVLALSLPFIAVCNVISAYNTATRRVGLSCTAQLIEQCVRMAVVFLFAVRFADKGLGIALSAVFFANALSEAVSCLFLYVFLPKRTDVPCTETRALINGAIPVALSRYLTSLLHTAENMLVPSALTLFYCDRGEALAFFGALKAMALPLLFFPYSFLNAVSTLLVPEVAEASVRKDSARMKNVIDTTCSFTLTMSVMLAFAFVIFSEQLGNFVYSSERVGALIMKLAPLVPFMYLDSVCDGLLKGLGLQKKVLYHNSIDSGSRILLIALLVPRFGINGFVGVMYFSNIFISVINLRLLLKTARVRFNFKDWVLTPVAVGFVLAFVTNFFSGNSASVTKTVVQGTVFCGLFALFAMFFYRRNKKSKIK